jgi:hypothetical protein
MFRALTPPFNKFILAEVSRSPIPTKNNKKICEIQPSKFSCTYTRGTIKTLMYTGEGENTPDHSDAITGSKSRVKNYSGGWGGRGWGEGRGGVGVGVGGWGGRGVTSRFSGLIGVRVILGIPFFRLSINYKCTPRVKELVNVEVHRFF